MPIFDQGYQHWDGKLAGHGGRWLTIARRGVAAQWRSNLVKGVVILALIPSLVLASFLILWGLIEQQSTLLAPFMGLLSGLPEEVRSGPKAYRDVYWTMAFHYFLGVELFFSMLLVLLVGPNLISQDLRQNAMPLYFARPLRRVDYFLGKLGVITAFVASVSIVPAVSSYLLGVSASLDLSVIGDTGRLLVGSVAYGAILVLSAGTLMLAISSLSKNSRMVGALWVGVWIVSGVAGTTLAQTVRQDWCPVVSYQADLLRLRESLLGTPAARAKLRELTEAGQRAARAVPFGGRVFGGRRRPPQPPGPGPGYGPPAQPGYDEYGNATYPWQWSAGVLAGLLGISTWILSTRVKSLDRLK